MENLHIMHLISGGDTGGAKTHVLKLINGLAESVQVDLVTLMESDFTEDAQNLKLPLQILKQKSRLDLSIIKDIDGIILNRGINLIHVHGARANFMATFIKRRHPKIPIVTTIHSDYLLDDYRGGQVLTRVFRKMNEHALRSMDYYIGVSDDFRDMMIRRKFADAKRVFSVYNGIDFVDETLISRTPKEFLEDHEVPYEEGVLYAGIMGRLDPVKDHYTFLKAAKILKQTQPNLRFLIAGEGSLEASLKKYARELDLENTVHFLGFVSKPYEFFNALDINVLTSLSESFPYVMLEGARMHLPLVTTAVGGVERVIKPGVTGYIVPVGDHESVAQGIESIAEDPDMRREMGERIYQIVKDNYSNKSFVERHLEIYTKILEDYQ